MIKRQIEKEIGLLISEFPIIAILGPRQSGKTTLSQKVFVGYEYISFEDYDVKEFAENDPRGFLKRYSQNVIFDEIQRSPKIISYLQTHVDAVGENGKIVITGSHNFLLMEQISQSLAGRVGICKLLPFSHKEIASISPELNQLIFNGFYPRIYDQKIRPQVFYKNYIATYIEKDLRELKHITNLDTFIRFMRVLAARTGQELKINSIADQCSISHNTVKKWLSVLETSFIIHKVKPYHKNYNKRLVKSPKIYFTDTGLVCSLIGIKSSGELDYHFMRGSIFETFVVDEILKANYNNAEPFEMYFWRDNHKKEIDLIVDFGLKQYGVEIKSTSTIAERHFGGLNYWKKLSGASWENLFIIYGGEQMMTRNGINVIPWKEIFNRTIQKEID